MRAQHTASVGGYLGVFAALLSLTAATVVVAGVPLGRWHTPIALGIAATKATLVVLFFMHVLRGPRLTWIVIGAAVFWLGIMLALTLGDYLTRGW